VPVSLATTPPIGMAVVAFMAFMAVVTFMVVAACVVLVPRILIPTVPMIGGPSAWSVLGRFHEGPGLRL
jgi:hypothetical protein